MNGGEMNVGEMNGVRRAVWWGLFSLLAVALAGCGAESSGGGASGEGDAGGDASTWPDGGGDGGDLEGGGGGKDVEGGDGSAAPPCATGAACDDGSPCTWGDRCGGDGQCAGTPYTCDDDRACTVDGCDGLGNCTFTISAGACLIGNACYAEGESPPANSCLVCAAGAPTFWTIATPRGCDDGDACTFGDLCEQGACAGAPITCDDGNPCTADTCDHAQGCAFTPTGGACDDGSACTQGDHCTAAGACAGAAALFCDDDNPCTADICNPANGCTHLVISAPCSDEDVCTVGDACVEGECVPGEPNPCNDGSSCTNDACDPNTGCAHTPNDNPCCQGGINPCDDGNPCTFDLCGEEAGSCLYEPFVGLCTDGNPCTTGDACVEGACIGTPKVCDDANPCTQDACVGGTCGFVPANDGLPCDDGVECTAQDQCTGGTCTGLDETACQCAPVFAPWVSKVATLAIGANGQPGQGVNVDGKAATCAPSSDCSGGVDNSLSVVASFANDALASALEEGSLILLFEHAGYAPGQAYTIQVHVGEAADPGCDVSAAGCTYLTSPDSFDDDCNAQVKVAGATISGGTLTAGGPGNNLTLPLPIAGLALKVTLYHLRLQATVTGAGTPQATLTGVLGGAVLKTELKAAIQALPDETFEPPLDKATILGFLDFLVTLDIDTNGDGTNDAASIGLPFTAVGGTIVGVAP